MGENDRPQDVGRRHLRRSGVAASVEILERYRLAMVRDLAATLDELEPVAAVQTSIDGTADKTVSLPIAARRERWDLAIKLAKELAAAPDAPPDPATRAALERPARRAAPRLSKRDRASIA